MDEPHDINSCPSCDAVLHIADLAANLRETTHTLYKWSSYGYPSFPRRLDVRNRRIKVTCRSLKTWKIEVER